MKRSFPIMVEFEEAPDYVDIFTMEEFIEAVKNDEIMDCDGIGYLAKIDDTGKIWESKLLVDSFYVSWFKRQSKDFTHICWYNKQLLLVLRS